LSRTDDALLGDALPQGKARSKKLLGLQRRKLQRRSMRLWKAVRVAFKFRFFRFIQFEESGFKPRLKQRIIPER